MLKTIFIVFFLVRGDDAVNRNQLQYLIGKTRAAYREIGVDVRPVRVIIVRKDPSWRLAKTPYDYKERFKYWDRWAAKKYRNIFPRAHRHIVLPPVWYNSLNWFYGVATGICTLNFSNSVSMGIATTKGFDVAQQLKKSLIVLLHELGHIFGMSHDDRSHNYMHPAAATFWKETLRFSELSKWQMRDCI